MTRDDLYREALEERRDELLAGGRLVSEADRLAKEQVKHDHDDGGTE